MSKPIKLTDALKEQALEEFKKELESLKMSDGKISYSKNFVYKDDEKAEVLFTSLAYSKMIKLLMSFDSEIAWHGVGERIEGDKLRVLITDILVYPQTVTGSTVSMDPLEYSNWIIENCEDDRLNHIVMQGHSHVNFSTSPSATDLQHQEDILSQLSDDMCYVFLIWNKKLEHTTKIYDLANNVLYEDKDITYGFADENFDLDAFLVESKALVKKHEVKQFDNKGVTSYGGCYGINYGGYGYSDGIVQQSENKIKSKQKGRSDIGSGYNGRGSEYMDDDGLDVLKDRFNT